MTIRRRRTELKYYEESSDTKSHINSMMRGATPVKKSEYVFQEEAEVPMLKTYSGAKRKVFSAGR